MMIRRRIHALGTVMFLFLAVGIALGQTGAGPEPRLPGAAVTAPSWLREAPFDVAKFFEMPPASENAAPLYLEALLDFGRDMSLCLPPNRRDRAAAAEAKAERIRRAYDRWDKDRDPAHLDRAEIDALAVVMRDALRKLDTAQRRPRCVFAAGIGYDVPIPHVPVSREVTRLWTLLAIRALDRGNPADAIGYVRRILRLSQDLRPRGHAIAQLAGAAVNAVACNILIPTILVHPRLQLSDCDQLLLLLKGHEARTVDSFAAGVKSTYITERALIRTFEDHVALTLDANNRAVDRSLDDDEFARYVMQLVSDIMSNVDASKKVDPKRLHDPASLEKMRAQIRAMNLNFAREHQALDECTKSLLSMPTVPYAQRIPRFDAVFHRYDPRAVPAGQGAAILVMTFPDARNLVESDVRDRLYVGAAQCLIAARRWQLLHQGKSAGLGVMCRAAGLWRVPVDEYGGSQLKMTVVAGEPVIYSAGPDGDDDGGLKDGDLGRVADGDWLFRLPKTSPSSRR
jgi:hypothetical protein